MSDLNFNDIACFREGLTNAERGKLALRLTRACEAAPEARPAALALGNLFDPAKREEALRLLNAMPSLPRRYVLSRYATLTAKARD